MSICKNTGLHRQCGAAAYKGTPSQASRQLIRRYDPSGFRLAVAAQWWNDGKNGATPAYKLLDNYSFFL